MNRKIFASIMTIAFAVSLLGAGTMAYFNHVLQVGKVTFTAGTLEIKLKDGASYPIDVKFDDMKPCYTRTLTFEIENVGDNPVDVYKHIYNVVCSENGVTVAEGQYYKDKNIPDPPGKNDIDTVILYDLWVEVYVPDGAGGYKKLWNQGIYDETVTIDDIESKWIYLGMLPVGAYMKVIQSYHMWEWTENWAQSDTMTFNIEVKGEQLKGQLTLENKDTTGDKYLILHDQYSGTLTYNVVGPTFKYSFTGKAPLTGTEYFLIYYADPWAGNNPGAYLGKGTTSGVGDVTISGDVDTGSLPISPDGSYPYGAKIWLVTGSDYNSGTASTGPMTGWNPTNYLFETGLIVYTKG